MARTKADNYDLKRDAITNKAAELFAMKGFGGASISNLAEACSVSKSLIYHYYGAKEDILFGVMKEHMDEINEAVNKSELRDDDPKVEFHNLTQALLDVYSGAENAQKVLLYDLNSLPPKARKTIISEQRKTIGRFEAVFLRVFPELINEKALTRSKIMLFFGMVNWVHTWFNPRGEIKRDDIATLAANTILK